MAGTDNHRNSGSRREKFGVESLVQTPTFMSIGTTAIELRFFKKKKIWTKWFWVYIIWCSFTEIFGILF